MRGGDILIRTAQNAPSNQTESAETHMNGKTPSGKVEMPVAMALLLAQNPRAISSFASMKPLCLRWNWPLWNPDGALNPDDLEGKAELLPRKRGTEERAPQSTGRSR